MQTVATPYALIDTSTGGIVARYTFDNSPEWWAWYREYLQSPQWHRRADRCKQRAGYKCQRCGIKAGAIRPDGSRAWMEAHHLSYKHAGDERDSELECDCDYCHKLIT